MTILLSCVAFLLNASAADSASRADRPVILLTGYEPFGDKKPNPSWEAIKDLDGTDWKDYRLVARQLPVVWGAPMTFLKRWVDEHQPVAIFSFGQGRHDGFDIESRAVNFRHPKALDNWGELPPDKYIVRGGPFGFESTAVYDELAGRLRKKGHPVRVSRGAGEYLCEECLYSLEYLKATAPLQGTVLFCHVPPVGVTIRWKKVRLENIQRFVLDTLETWHTVYHGESAVAVRTVGEKTKVKDDRDEERKEVRDFITRYFKTWSDQDMKAYESLFLPDAAIQHIDSRGRVSTSMRPDFIQSQIDYHRGAEFKTTEVAETVDIRFEEKLARVVVYWKLTAGPRLDYGYDHFTLMKRDGSWRIVNLVFYNTPKKK